MLEPISTPNDTNSDDVKILINFLPMSTEPKSMDTTIQHIANALEDTQQLLCSEISFIKARFNGTIKCVCKRHTALRAIRLLVRHIKDCCEAFGCEPLTFNVLPKNPTELSEYDIVISVSSFECDLKTVLSAAGTVCTLMI